MLYAALLAILGTMLLAIIRAVQGPTAYDRMLATNLFGTKAVLFLVLGGYAFGWSGYADIALLYAMINFIGTIAVMRFFEYQQVTDSPEENSHE